ncbi:MAG: 4Fe-4S dicluster domain-containing protein [Ruminococcaceae bacterium]|nr:4Fe-4S dicluster domain-containing protein [Oscillospiraceae bacterium]
MKRRIIRINSELCNGCGACAAACHEGAIQMVNGKAVLVREDYCDGLGDCLPACPVNAITFEIREAPAYNEAAVQAAKNPCKGGCPGVAPKQLSSETEEPERPALSVSRLAQWPCQIKLVPPNAPYLENAHLLIAADCTAFAHGGFHQTFMKNRITLIGCPKLDAVDYAEKLTQILLYNEIQSITTVRMEVPCCGGLPHAVDRAILQSGKAIPHRVVTLSTNGKILS